LSFVTKSVFRQASVKSFPFVVYFEITSNAVVVYSVFHTKRKPKSDFSFSGKALTAFSYISTCSLLACKTITCFMSLPLFYITDMLAGQPELTLDEDTSKHIVGVLRMKKGEQLHLTNGKGFLLLTAIVDDHKKRCRVQVLNERFIAASERKTSIAISLLKNANRFEWFLEKATELGISEIIPMICDRTEKQQFRYDRMHNILVSAMLQSQQTWLPVLHQPIGFGQLLKQEDVITTTQKFIAHCMPGEKQSLAGLVNSSLPSHIILIGPEGDFTKEEIAFATDHYFIPVSLGATRLRTETAGMAAAVLLSL
jgi:16S rRNA (uracil1498-N3)-methyltransferase